LGLALEEPKEHIKRHEIGGIDFSISEGVLPYTAEQKIDYINQSGDEGFIITPVFGKGC